MSLSEARRWERHMRRFIIDPKTGCWNWTGAIKPPPNGGYGLVRMNYRQYRAHRVFYERFVGPIPDDLLVRHSCDNRRCVNPEHLLVGTHADNSNDMVVRGRSNKKEFCPKGHRLGDKIYADKSRCVQCRKDRANRYARRIAAAALVAASAIPSTSVDATPTGLTRAPRGAAAVMRADVTRLVQQRLHDFGYTIKVDSIYGPQTRRVVSAWQKANGLIVDGIAGPATVASLGPVNFATAAPSPAVRSSPPVPIPVGSESDCEEMSRYRQAAGLPEQFDQIGYRESRCQNTVGNSCCFGWFANYLSSHLSTQSAYRDRIINECGVTTSARSEIQGDSDAQKRAQACVTYVVYSISGMSPWNL